MTGIAVIASTGGSVMKYALADSPLAKDITVVLSDRECGAINAAAAMNIETLIMPSDTGDVFSQKLMEFFSRRPDITLVISFYTRLFTAPLVESLKGRFINFHPSILPACPGLDGFGDTLKSGSRFIGSTVHFIDSGTDTGLPILQAGHPYNPEKTEAENRHVVFLQQCKQLRQIIIWHKQGRLSPTGIIKEAQYKIGEFSPNLDAPEALEFHI